MRRMKATNRRVTYAETLEWPDDGRRYELYDGEVVVVPAPVLRHQRIALHLMDPISSRAPAVQGHGDHGDRRTPRRGHQPGCRAVFPVASAIIA
jgi:hypothetical protein